MVVEMVQKRSVALLELSWALTMTFNLALRMVLLQVLNSAMGHSLARVVAKKQWMIFGSRMVAALANAL